MKFLLISKKSYNFISKALAIAGILALFLLAAGLKSIEFQPGQYLITQGGSPIIFPMGKQNEVPGLASLCLSGILVMFPLAAILIIFSAEARRLFRKYAKALILWFGFLFCVRFFVILLRDDRVILEMSGRTTSLPQGFSPPSSIGTETGTVPIYTPPDLPNWQGYLLGFIFVVAIGWIAFYIWERYRSPKNELGEISRNTLKDLYEGRQWEDAVIQCYAQMNELVSRGKGLTREASLTPAEFAQELEIAGLPSEPISRLTHLFELARYSDRSSQTSEAQAAISCITEITQALKIVE